MSQLALSIGPLQLLVGAATVLSVAALVVSMVTARLGQARVEAAEARCGKAQDRAEDSIGSLQAAVEALSAQVRDAQLHAAPGPAAPTFRPGLNMNKRSQILRMHRRGESPDQIAASLEIPLQEVDLLLKVHRIVLSTV